MKNEELKMQNVFISIHPFCIKTGIKSAAVTGVGPSQPIADVCGCLWGRAKLSCWYYKWNIL